VYFNRTYRRFCSENGFTLIELLIVIALLGALASVVLPRVIASRTAAWDDSIVPQEMSRIRLAFDEFVCDCAPTANDWVRITATDLAILMEYDADTDWSFPETYDAQRGKGWRGPYLIAEGRLNERPVIFDPYYSDELTNHHYRVEQSNSVTQLVFIGADHELDTADDQRSELHRN
jgi:prepilin-type N-terminal cleavage/methylation domain-containing protein